MKKFVINDYKENIFNKLDTKITIREFYSKYKKLILYSNIIRVIFYKEKDRYKNKIGYDSEIEVEHYKDLSDYYDDIVLSFRTLYSKSFFKYKVPEASLILYVYGSKYDKWNPNDECDNPDDDYEDLLNVFND